MLGQFGAVASIPLFPDKQRNVGPTVGPCWGVWGKVGGSKANVPPKVAQTLARHSTISLTMDRYTHLGIDDLVAGLKRLPVMAGGNGVVTKV